VSEARRVRRRGRLYIFSVVMRRVVGPIVVLVAAALAFSAAPVCAQAPPLQPPPVPVRGSYLGASASVNPGESRLAAIERTERLIGRPLDIDHQFYRWNDSLITSVQHADAAAGRYPFVSWKPQRTNGQIVRWPTIAAGAEDTTIRTQAQAARAFGHPMFLVFHHEPYDESVNTTWGTPADFVAAYRRVVSIFRQEGALNVAFVLVLTSWDYTQDRADAFYPGPDVIDWIAADPYNWHQRDGRWDSLESVARDFYEWGSRTGKPLMLAEWGSTEDPANPARKAAWYAEAAQTLAEWPNIKAAVYFNNLHDGYDWRIDTSAASLDAFRRLATSGHFDAATVPPYQLDCSGAPTFADVPPGHVHAAAIACAAVYGILGAFSSAFEPDRHITRGELASFTMRTLQAAGVQAGTGQTSYSDIAATPDANAIRRLADLEVLHGYPDGTFRPGDPVTRAQLGTILTRAHDLVAPDPLALPAVPRFSDCVGNVHAAGIERAGRANLVTGVRPGVFDPTGNATRGQVAAILTRLLRFVGSEGVTVHRA
jgi:hypothetical protein